MEEVILLFEQLGWKGNEGLAEDAIARLEAILGVVFPGDYRAFLGWADGGEDSLGAAYLTLLSAEELEQFNREHFRDPYPGLVQIGGNGGLEAYCLDYRADATQPGMVAVDLNNPDPTDYWPLGSSFTQAMRRLTVMGEPWPPGTDPDEAPAG